MQQHFRKKNAAAIDSYEEAVKYVNEHIKDYYIDGRAHKRSELEAMSLELKDWRKALTPEQKSFLAKCDTALKYTRQMRRYITNSITSKSVRNTDRISSRNREGLF